MDESDGVRISTLSVSGWNIKYIFELYPARDGMYVLLKILN